MNYAITSTKFSQIVFIQSLPFFHGQHTHKYLSSRSFVLGENVVSQMYWCIITKNTSLFNSTIVEVLETMLLDGYAAMTGLSRHPFLGRPCLDFFVEALLSNGTKHAATLADEGFTVETFSDIFQKATRQQHRVTG